MTSSPLEISPFKKISSQKSFSHEAENPHFTDADLTDTSQMRVCAPGLEDSEAKTDADKLSVYCDTVIEEKQTSPALVKIPSRFQADPSKCIWRKFTQ